MPGKGFSGSMRCCPSQASFSGLLVSSLLPCPSALWIAHTEHVSIQTLSVLSDAWCWWWCSPHFGLCCRMCCPSHFLSGSHHQWLTGLQTLSLMLACFPFSALLLAYSAAVTAKRFCGQLPVVSLVSGCLPPMSHAEYKTTLPVDSCDHDPLKASGGLLQLFLLIGRILLTHCVFVYSIHQLHAQV